MYILTILQWTFICLRELTDRFIPAYISNGACSDMPHHTQDLHLLFHHFFWEVISSCRWYRQIWNPMEVLFYCTDNLFSSEHYIKHYPKKYKTVRYILYIVLPFTMCHIQEVEWEVMFTQSSKYTCYIQPFILLLWADYVNRFEVAALLKWVINEKMINGPTKFLFNWMSREA